MAGNVTALPGVKIEVDVERELIGYARDMLKMAEEGDVAPVIGMSLLFHREDGTVAGGAYCLKGWPTTLIESQAATTFAQMAQNSSERGS